MERLLTACCLAFGGDGGLAFTPLGGDGLGFDLLAGGVVYAFEASADPEFPEYTNLVKEPNLFRRGDSASEALLGAGALCSTVTDVSMGQGGTAGSS